MRCISNKPLTLVLFVLANLTLGCKEKFIHQEGLKEASVRKIACADTVEIFGDSRFQKDVFRGSFSPDGQIFYFFKKINPEDEDYRIFRSSSIDGEWSDPEKVILEAEYSDLYPSISKDGKRMVFSSYRPVPEIYRSANSKNAHLWYAEKENDGWGKPIFMANANEIGHYHSWVEFGWDNKVYFRRTTPDWSFTETLYTQWNGAAYSMPKPFEEVARWKNWSEDLQIAGGSPGPFENLVFLDVATQNSETGKRGSDIWISIKKDEIWGNPFPLNEKVNGDGYDVFPFFSPGGECLYFVRDFNKFYKISLKEVLAKQEIKL